MRHRERAQHRHLRLFIVAGSDHDNANRLSNKSHDGMQGVYKHASRETKTDMTFSVYVPPHPDGARLPVVYYLSGLTCTHSNVTEKSE